MIDCTESIPIMAHKMTMGDFVESCIGGFFSDYDGFGCYSDGKKMSSKHIIPSDAIHGKHDTRYSHVIWFNR
jgi:hypothetical protein